MLDRVDIRILAGVQVLDHLSGQPIREGIVFRNSRLAFSPTSSGIWAVRTAPGFEAYTRSFDEVPVVPAQSFAFEVHDVKRRFHPLAASLDLPRSLDSADPAARVDTPVTVTLPSAPARKAVAGWTTIHVSVLDQNGAPVRGALVQAHEQPGDAELGWSMTGPNGMAQLPLTGIAHLRDGIDDGDENTVDLITATTRVRIRATADIAQPWPADPVALRAGGPTTRTIFETEVVRLTAGSVASQTVELNLN